MLENRHLFRLAANVGEAQAVPGGPYGDRRYIPVLGGSFEGERLSGAMLPGGADCQLIRPDGVAELDVRTSFRTNDGVIFFMKALGIRQASAKVQARMMAGEDVSRDDYYFREAMQFEAPPGKYDWLNAIIAVGIGERTPNRVLIDVYEIL